MSRFEALLAHQGPLVHVDHSHRLAATGSLLHPLHYRHHHHHHGPATPRKPTPEEARASAAKVDAELAKIDGKTARRVSELRALVGGSMASADLNQMLYLAETLGVLKHLDSSPQARAGKRKRLAQLMGAASKGLPPNQAWRVTALVQELETLSAKRYALANPASSA